MIAIERWIEERWAVGDIRFILILYYRSRVIEEPTSIGRVIEKVRGLGSRFAAEGTTFVIRPERSRMPGVASV